MDDQASKQRQAQCVRRPDEKAGCASVCGWKHFFVLIFLLLFVSRQKVRELEATIDAFIMY
jgi:hypothetical protein